MNVRCLNSKDQAFLKYGGRGITVSNEWLNFDNFKRDMLSSYKSGLTLERIDNNEGYSKNNCKWATRKEQANNRRSNHLFTYKGISDTLVNWANILRIKRSTLAQRFYVYGWSVERTLSEGMGI